MTGIGQQVLPASYMQKIALLVMPPVEPIYEAVKIRADDQEMDICL